MDLRTRPLPPDEGLGLTFSKKKSNAVELTESTEERHSEGVNSKKKYLPSQNGSVVNYGETPSQDKHRVEGLTQFQGGPRIAWGGKKSE